MPQDLAAKAQQLRGLHAGDRPLVLANVWDVASARTVAEAGVPALATSSSAIAACLGHRDDDSMPVAEVFDVIARIATAADLPVTADLEAGYRLAAPELVARLLEAGAVGCNLEDSDHHGSGALVPAEAQAERIAAVRQAAAEQGVPVVLNARIDVFRGGAPQDEDALAEALRRARLYIDAGADCVFPILLADEALIAAFVKALDHPVNILWREPLTVPALAALGVARISMGGGLLRTARAAMADQARRLLTAAGDPQH